MYWLFKEFQEICLVKKSMLNTIFHILCTLTQTILNYCFILWYSFILLIVKWNVTTCRYEVFVQKTRRVPLGEQELLTLPEHLSSPLVLSGVRVARSLVLCVYLVDRCLSFYPFYFGYCVVCSSIYRFWLPLWYLQTLLAFIWYLL